MGGKGSEGKPNAASAKQNGRTFAARLIQQLNVIVVSQSRHLEVFCAARAENTS